MKTSSRVVYVLLQCGTPPTIIPGTYFWTHHVLFRNFVIPNFAAEVVGFELSVACSGVTRHGAWLHGRIDTRV